MQKRKADIMNVDRPARKEIIPCWEILRCDETECPVYISKDDLRCWLVSGTHCRKEIQGAFLEKMEMCVTCKAFTMNMDASAMKKTMKVVSKQFKDYRAAIEDRERELRTISNEMAIGISETFEGLRKIASGDPTVRIDERSGIELISKLKHIVNMTASEIAEIVNQSHEIAIGLAEHFDILHRVSSGEMAARVSGSSKTELLESLKHVTNEMIESISHEIKKRENAEEILRERSHELWERVKELNCLYSIFELVDKKGISLEEILQETVERIPFGWKYPEITCARISIDNVSYKTDNYQETGWNQTEDIFIHGEKVGAIEVCYLEEKPERDDGPFEKEERNLLNTIAKHTGRVFERKRAQENLRRSEETYRTVFENTGNATVIVEEDMTISLVNSKFEKLSGYTKQDIEGRMTWKDFFSKEDKNVIKKYHNMRRTDAQTTPTNYETHFIDREGNMRNVLVSASVIPGTKKSVESLLDITERKKLEEQMYQTEKLASIGTLAAGVAHEINNPLAIILGFTDLLLEKISADSDVHELLMLIQKHGMNAKRIVENLLSFVRYREHSEEVVDINKIINEVLTVKGNTLTLNNIVIQRKLATGLPELKGNPGELQQAFFNIVNNAIAAMEEGGTLKVETASRESKRSIEVIISDTGTGIKPEDRTRIFDPLFTTKKVGEGTGLGLTVTYAIIKKYGGEIAFETRTKEESRESGTTFIITLPTLPA